MTDCNVKMTPLPVALLLSPASSELQTVESKAFPYPEVVGIYYGQFVALSLRQSLCATYYVGICPHGTLPMLPQLFICSSI